MENKPNRHITLWMILILLILAVAGMVAYIYWDKTEEIDQAAAEKQAWLNIQQFESNMQLDSLESAISYYQWNFVNGQHADQVRILKEKIEAEKKDWAAVRYTDAVEEMEDFIRNHSNSFFRNEANRKLDSLTYLEAADEDTYQAYEQYLDSYSDGMYAQVAKQRMERIDDGSVSDHEVTDVGLVINNHFVALAKQNKELLKSTVADVVTSYMGKSDVTPADVEKYMFSIHSDNSRDISFQIRNLIINKEVENHIPTYSGHFVLTEIVHQGEKTIQHTFAGMAKINSEGLITSLVLSQQS